MAGLVSVIVPVYNVEPYLPRCLDSLLDQTYEHIEIIVVNDGSTDGSGEICRAYAQRHAQIAYHAKENEGISATRNFGLERACGEYVMFVDSDDHIDADMVSRMVDDGARTGRSGAVRLSHGLPFRRLASQGAQGSGMGSHRGAACVIAKPGSQQFCLGQAVSANIDRRSAFLD